MIPTGILTIYTFKKNRKKSNLLSLYEEKGVVCAWRAFAVTRFVAEPTKAVTSDGKAATLVVPRPNSFQRELHNTTHHSLPHSPYIQTKVL
jgi:hypothetical protein